MGILSISFTNKLYNQILPFKLQQRIISDFLKRSITRSLVQKVKNPKEKGMSMQISSDAPPLIGELLSSL